MPPGDKTPITDYLLAQNWRVDREGRLVSRYGYPQKFLFASGPTQAHSAAIHGGIGGDYYVGAINGAGAGGVYYNFNPTAIATGLSGSRVGFAAMNGWMWVMDSQVQGRHNGASGWESWGLAAPATACSAAAGSGTPTYATSVTYTYTLQGNANYEHSLTIAGTTYSFAENGYSSGQLATVIAALAANDAHCSVTAGAGGAVTIAPTVSGSPIAVSGSDGNAGANLAINYTAPITYPNGTYEFYVTYETNGEDVESNPGPASAAVTVTNQEISLTSIPTSSDARVGMRNIYATGGTLGNAYLVGVINDNTATTFTVAISDLQATEQGIQMPTTNGPPPAAKGMCGPYFARLFAWNTAAHPNRLYYTDPNVPQYFPGSADPAVGNWVDVGEDGEQIMWCTAHTQILVIYKERSIWRLVGDPDTGYLERMEDGIGLVNPWAVVAAGHQDYFVAPNGLRVCNLDRTEDFSGPIRPLFQSGTQNPGSAMYPPGGILPGTDWGTNPIDTYGVALGYGLGKLYVAYREATTLGSGSSCTLVYDEQAKRWMYHRNGLQNAVGFRGFLFDGVNMVGLGSTFNSGTGLQQASGYRLDDFRAYYSQDEPTTAIECVYQGHYEDCGLPDNQKVWLEVVVDCELAGDTLTVYVSTDAGARPLTSVGTITASGRSSTGFALAANAGTGLIEVRNPSSTSQVDLLARNLSVAIDCTANHPVILHNVYLYYYEEARLASSASTLPTDLGLARVKQCKELMVDIDATGGAVNVNVISDLPGNALAVRQTAAVSATSGRALLKFPFAAAEGYLWRLLAKAVTGPFRLYSARLLMRPIGVYVEAYESSGGFVWDSMEQTFESGLTHVPRLYALALAAVPIKRFREVSLEIDTFNAGVVVNFLTDLPGNAQTLRWLWNVNTGTAGRRFVRLPLPAGFGIAYTEGRMCRIQIVAGGKFVLYGASVEVLAVGQYIEAYEASGGAVYDSREFDFGSAKPKEARELELDLETDASSPVTVTLYSDLPGYTMASVFSASYSTTGRQKLRIPVTLSTAPYYYPMGRMYRLMLTASNAFRLYEARLKLREFGCYLTGDEASASPVGVWDSTPLDFGSERLKDFKKLELDIQTGGTVTVTVWTDQGTGTLAPTASTAIDTSGVRQAVKWTLPPGVRGRLMQVEVSGAGVRLFAGWVWLRPLNEPKAEWSWAPLPIEPTAPTFQWMQLPVAPTPPVTQGQDPAQWFWAKVLAVDETPDKWEWVDVPFEVQG